MHKVDIDQRILDRLGLSERESIVFNALLEYSLPNSVQRISERCKLPRMTTFDILRRLEKRKLAVRILPPIGKVLWWQYKKGLEKF